MGPQSTELSTGAARRWFDGLRPALLGWLGARAAVALGFLLAHALSGSVTMPDGRLHLNQGLMTWDGTYYRVIVQGWYGGPTTPPDAIRFFPGYPALARLIRPITFGNTDVALLLLANFAALLAALLLWHLVIEVIGEPRAAARAAWMVAVIPAANVLAFAYSESLMLLVVTGLLLALHRRNLAWVCVLGLFGALLRPVGILLAVPIAVEAGRWWHEDARRERSMVLSWIIAIGAPAAGLVTALAWVSNEQDMGEAFRLQRQLRAGFRDPVTRLGQAFWDMGGGHLHDVYNVAFALGFLALFAVAARHRQPLSWLAFMAVTWVVAVGGNNMDSVGRYCLVASPFAIALAQWSRRRWQQFTVATVGLLGTTWFTTEVLLGRIIP